MGKYSFFATEKGSLRSAPEKRVGPDRQHPVCQVAIAFLFPRTKIIRRPKGGGIVGGVRQTASQSLPRPLLEKKGGGLALVKLGQGQKTGDGTPSIHDRDRNFLALPDLVFSMTVRLDPPRTVPVEGSASSRTPSSEWCGSLRSVRKETLFLLLFIFAVTDYRELWAFSPGGGGQGAQGRKSP